jgi:hypothetical protein
MPQQNRIEVINKYGWRKEFVIDKPIVQIGRDARNDIVLDDGHDNSIVARHAQLLPSTVNRLGMRLINLSDREIQVLPGGASAIAAPGGATGIVQATRPPVTLAARSSGEVAPGDALKIGEFTLIFHGGEQQSGVLKLDIESSGTLLELERPLTGTLTIRHLGNQAAVQFKIEVDGLDPDVVEIGPGPVLFPNAEKQVPFRLRHPKRAFPPAGKHRVTFTVSAPAAYPDERATIALDLQIAPFYRHKMRVMVIEAQDYHLTM